MRAVNLIPAEARRGSGAPGRSGSAVYVLLGALAVAVVAIFSYVLVQNSVSDRQAELTKVTRDANAAQAQAAALKPYSEFAQLSQTRVQTVNSLANSRFDWEQAMRDLALVLPSNVWLTSFVGTVAPGISFGDTGAGSGSNTGTLRSSQPVPAVELVGCADSQAEVARVLSRLRLVRGVTQVSLASSEKADAVSASGGGGGGGAAGDTDCRHGSDKFPQFQVVAFFKPLPGVPGRAPAPGAAAQAGAKPAGTSASSPTDQTTPTAGKGAANAANNAATQSGVAGGAGK